MSHNLEAEAKKKFKVPKTLLSDNYSPNSLERAEVEFQEAWKVVLVVRQKWIAEEEAKEAERVRKKENEARRCRRDIRVIPSPPLRAGFGSQNSIIQSSFF